MKESEQPVAATSPKTHAARPGPVSLLKHRYVRVEWCVCVGTCCMSDCSATGVVSYGSTFGVCMCNKLVVLPVVGI